MTKKRNRVTAFDNVIEQLERIAFILSENAKAMASLNLEFADNLAKAHESVKDAVKHLKDENDGRF